MKNQHSPLIKPMKFLRFFLMASLVLSCGHEGGNGATETKPQIRNGIFVDLASAMKKSGATHFDVIKADKDMRIQVTQGIKQALLNQYALIHLKEKRILTADGQPFNTVDHLNKCIDIENNTDDTSDLHFIDRLKQCIAGFQDTHLGLTARVPTPTVNAGILIRRIADKYYINARQPELLDYLKKTNKDDKIDDITAIGNEVIAIDGKSPAELSQHYATYNRASSDGFRNLTADLNILYRDFDYPTKNYVELTVKSHKQTYHYKLPWWASPNTAKRQDAKEYFDNLGIPTSDRVQMLHSADGKIDWANIKSSFKGYFESDPIIKPDPFSPLVAFNSEKGTPAARMGVINTFNQNANQNFCYLELLTFSAESLIPENANKGDTYLETVKRFVKSCKEKNLDLVMDLRSNNGGFGSYPYKILSYLAKADSSLGGKVIAFRPNQISERLVSSILNHPELNSGDLDDIDVRSLTEIKRTLTLQHAMTGALPVTQEITADPEIGGFEGKVIALVTPSCISACDGMSALLKRSGRGTLIGTHSNGTGAGFIDSESLDSMYRDSYLEVVVRIPNYQFGYSSHPFTSLDPIDFDANADEYFTENKPTIADVQTDTTLADIKGTSHTWLDAISKELNTF